MNVWNWLALICLAIIVLILISMGGVGAFLALAATGEITLQVVVMVVAVIMAIVSLIKDPNLFSKVCNVISSGVSNISEGVGSAIRNATQGVSSGLMNGFGPLLIGGLGVVALFLILRRE